MASPTCGLCGRTVDQSSSNSVSGGGLWFCSPSHLLDYETRPRASYSRSRTAASVIVALLIVAAALAYLGSRDRTPDRAPPVRPSSLSAAQIVKALRSELNPGHAQRISGSLNDNAVRVSDAFVLAEYVDRSCHEAMRVATPYRIGAKLADGGVLTSCPGQIDQIHQWGYHLVQASRQLSHHCLGVTPLAGTLRAPECVTYEIVGRSAYQCERTLESVFVMRFGGRWTVLYGDQGSSRLRDDYGGKCNGVDLGLWRHRIVYRRAG